MFCRSTLLHHCQTANGSTGGALGTGIYPPLCGSHKSIRSFILKVKNCSMLRHSFPFCGFIFSVSELTGTIFLAIYAPFFCLCSSFPCKPHFLCKGSLRFCSSWSPVLCHKLEIGSFNLLPYCLMLILMHSHL